MRVIVSAWIGSANAGDELIFAALRRKLRARGAHVTAITTDPGSEPEDGVAHVSHRSPHELLGAVRASDVLIFGGGGLLQDQTSAFNLPYHLSRLGLAAAVGTPRAVVGIGAGPLRTAVGRAQVRLALRGTLAVSARDERSVRVLHAARVANVRLAADLALSLPAPGVAAADVICACLRPWSATRRRLPVAARARADTTPDDMVARLAYGLDEAAGRLGLPVRLVAMQPGRDDLLHRRVADRMVAPVTLLSPPSHEVIDAIAASRVVVAMRYHAGIAALLAGRPATLIGYDPKLSGLADAMGSDARLLAWERDDLDGLGAATAAVAERGQGLPAVLAVLRERERINDAVLDDALARAGART